MSDYRNSSTYPVLEHSDGYSYFLWAKDISSGQLLPDKAFMKWPLYAYLLAFLLKIFQNNIALVYLFQHVLGAVNCVLVYFIARKVFDERTGFFAGLLCAFYGLFIFYDSLLVYTGLSLFLNSLLFLSFLSVKDRPNSKNLFWLGVFLGISAIIQANVVIFGIVATLWILRKKALSARKFFGNFLFFILGSSIVIGAVTLSNYVAEKDFVLIAGNTGFNFYSGNNSQATGTFYCPDNIVPNQKDIFRDSRIAANHETGRSLNTKEVSEFWFRKALDFIRNNPIGYLKLLFKKIVFVFGPEELVHDIEYHFIKPQAKVFKAMFTDLRFILPLSLLGMFFSARDHKAQPLLYIAILGLSCGIVMFFVTARYRIMIVPYLAVFAGYAISSGWELIKNKKSFNLSVLCLAAIAVSFLLDYVSAQLVNAGSKDNKAAFEYHYMRALDYRNNSDFANALKELELAEIKRPHNTGVYLQAGVLLYRMNDFRAAEEKFRQAIETNPLSVDAYYNLGLIYNRQKRFREAKKMLIRAIQLDPEDTEAHFELGLAYKSLREAKNAREEFGIALKKLNRWRNDERLIIEKELAALEK